MSIYAGLWIDHSNAHLVISNALGDMTVQSFEGYVEPHHHGGETEEHLTLTNQKSHDERRHNQMREFCETILPHLSAANELLIFGPGTGKSEFKNVLEKNKALAGKFKGLETADKLSESELKEFVKKYFKLPRQ